MAIEIIEARDEASREAIFRFRYEIYVREMRRPQKDADHERGRIEDSLDAFAVLLAAKDTSTGRIVGTVRSNVLGDGSAGPYEALYGLAHLAPSARRVTAITTRLMVERNRRGTVLASMLATALFGIGHARGVEADFIDCNAHLVPFFARLGYREAGMIEHPEYGLVTLMRLDLQDDAFLRKIGSPFAGVQERRVMVRG